MGAIVRTFKPSVAERDLGDWWAKKQATARKKDPDLMTQGDVHMCGDLFVDWRSEPAETEEHARYGSGVRRGEAIALRYRGPSPGMVKRDGRWCSGKGPIRWLVIAVCPN